MKLKKKKKRLSFILVVLYILINHFNYATSIKEFDIKTQKLKRFTSECQLDISTSRQKIFEPFEDFPGVAIS